jgi:hypothetical protein
LIGAASGAPEAVAFDTEGTSAAVVGDGTSITVSAGAYLMACAINSSVTPTVTVGGHVTAGDDNTTIGARVTNAADSQGSSGSKTATFTYNANTGNKLMMAVSVAEAAATGLTITSVNTTNTAFSAQTDSAVVGTGLSASVVCTYAGIACTNESASSSTSLKITFPNFFTNNIKLGRNYEFKVVG